MSAAGPVARRDDLVVRELDGETLVYDLDSHYAHCLNETAAAVWRACDGKTKPAAIAAELGYEEEVVWLALEELWKLSLLEGETAPEPGLTLSRRRLLKTALVAIPVAATIAAPPAAGAASCSGLEGPCTTVDDCCPNICSISETVVCDAGNCRCAF
jgi:hypothetical protein